MVRSIAKQRVSNHRKSAIADLRTHSADLRINSDLQVAGHPSRRSLTLAPQDEGGVCCALTMSNSQASSARVFGQATGCLSFSVVAPHNRGAERRTAHQTSHAARGRLAKPALRCMDIQRHQACEARARMPRPPALHYGDFSLRSRASGRAGAFAHLAAFAAFAASTSSH